MLCPRRRSVAGFQSRLELLDINRSRPHPDDAWFLVLKY